MHYLYNYVTKALIAQTVCNHDLSQIKKECERNQVFYYVESFCDEEPITTQSLAVDVIEAINESNEAFILWIDGKPSKISSDRQTLFGEYNDAKYEGRSVDITWHEHYQDAYDIVLAQATSPNPNRFIKSSFTLSLLWVAKFYRSLSDSYKRNCNQELSAWRSSIKSYKLYRYYLGLSTGLMTTDSLNSYRWCQT